MQRILQAKNKSKLRRPPQFAELIGPLRMLSMCEQLDGLRFDVAGGLSEKFQLGTSWNFSNTKPSNFTLITTFSPNGSQQNMDSANVIHCKKDAGGKLEFVGIYHLMKGLSLRTEGFFPNENVGK